MKKNKQKKTNKTATIINAPTGNLLNQAEFTKQLEEKKSQTENKNFWKKYVFNYSTLMVLLTIIGIIVAIIGIGPKRTIKDEITDKIAQIRKDFSPEELKADNDSLGEIKIMKDFQKATLDFCTIYEGLETSSLENTNFKDINNAVTVLSQFVVKMQQMNLKQKAANNSITALVQIALEHSIEDYALIDMTKQQEINNLLDKLKEIHEEELMNIKRHVKNRDLEKIRISVNRLHNNEANLKEIDSFLKFVIDTNNIFKMRLNNLKANQTM